MRVLELKVPPPIVALVAAVLMWLISRSLPVFAFVFPARNAFAIGLVAAGFIIGILARTSHTLSWARCRTAERGDERCHSARDGFGERRIPAGDEGRELILRFLQNDRDVPADLRTHNHLLD
jgi:hypothetical protein